MSEYGLQCVIGTALVDGSFRERLLKDARAALAGFELSAAERKMAASIRARSLQEYAGRLEQKLTGAEASGRGWSASPVFSRSDDLAVAAG